MNYCSRPFWSPLPSRSFGKRPTDYHGKLDVIKAQMKSREALLRKAERSDKDVFDMTMGEKVERLGITKHGGRNIVVKI